jgi:hypothetical protein
VIDESDLQCKKQFDSRISIFLGTKIDSSDESENVSDSIRVKCEFDSNIGCSETIYPNEVLVLEENPNYAHLKFRGIDGL